MAVEGAGSARALTLRWCFGFNKDINGMQCISDSMRQLLFYPAANTGVLYNIDSERQTHLQGHVNAITCTAVSRDKHWIVSADRGRDSMVIVWDSTNASPVRSLFTPPEFYGTAAMDISPDGMYIVTLSYGLSPQRIALWEWTAERTEPLYVHLIPHAHDGTSDTQVHVRFNPNNIHQVVTNGPLKVMFWSWGDAGWRCDVPRCAEYNQKLGLFTQSVFFSRSDQTEAVSATTSGDVVMWEELPQRSKEKTEETQDAAVPLVTSPDPPQMRPLKIVKLHHHGAINVITVMDNYIVTGGAEGFVRFFDCECRINHWIEEQGELNAGPLTAIAFKLSDKHSIDGFFTDDFIIQTSKAHMVMIGAHEEKEKAPMGHQAGGWSNDHQISRFYEATRPGGMRLFEGMSGEVHGLVAHPTHDAFVCCTQSGQVQMWSTKTKKIICQNIFEGLSANCVAFESRAQFVAVGCSNGIVKFLKGDRLTEESTGGHHQTNSDGVAAITRIVFSHCSLHAAAADSDGCVLLFNWAAPEEDSTRDKQWVYIGRHRAHRKPIVDVFFVKSPPGQFPRLISVGEDRRLVEYDIQSSSVFAGLRVKAHQIVEQFAIPTACLVVYDQEEEHDVLLLANSQLKIKIWDLSSPLRFQKTVLGPAFTHPVTKMMMLPTNATTEGGEHMAFITAEKIAGLVKFPLDGNPTKVMGLIAHPGMIANLAVSHDAEYMLTAGGPDLVVNLWEIELATLDAAVYMGHEGGGQSDTSRLDPYCTMIDGGKGGDVYEEIVDYFYYAQLKRQGELSTSSFKIEGHIPLDEVPNLWRALGYYPTDWQINELKMQLLHNRMAQAKASGEPPENVKLADIKITFQEFVILYINYRPVLNVSIEEIQTALESLKVVRSDKRLLVDPLTQILSERGERMSPEELETVLLDLTGSGTIEPGLPVKQFIEQILGFQEVVADGKQPQAP
eukprot:gnl/Spiro4/25468_TR12702_c0_g2_i1.p1 gnl/Spiro4/25468_TR12702_c0_g2~~gnl/Spiro4/25468_TR12702_c0_g2_i1.p1  ORF type:complete len:971 (+),score=302.48 gnl/Spiro4/25468_TR12702_c0_g2_i1:59-2914(+)